MVKKLLEDKIRKLKAGWRGFTLIEVLLVIAILAIIFGYTIGAGSNFYFNQALISERDSLIGLLRNARSRALANINQSSHGIFMSTSTNQYIIFDGPSYASRAVAYDLAFPKSAALTVTGPAEIVFSSPEGASNVSGTIILSGGAGAASISINSEGGINW